MGIERFLRRQVRALKPNAELRKALDEADKCMAFFNDGKFIDYFQSLNEVYLNNKGNISQGPVTDITTGLSEDMELENQALLELDQAIGSARASLEWEDFEEDRNLRKNISMTLGYHSSADCFSLLLFASTEGKFGEEKEGGLLKTGTSLQRNFYLNPESNLSKHIDDLLLTFTNELFESGIL